MLSSRQATRAPAWSQRWLQHEKRPAKHIQSIKQPGVEHMHFAECHPSALKSTPPGSPNLAEDYMHEVSVF